MTAINFSRNNLDKSLSPYLLQHKENPIWWQEWSKEAVEYALSKNKIIFASIGYATCHWCHRMAGEAFSDEETADFLNANFVSIKVDREQRPDIDQYSMGFIFLLTGQGGWPLNIFFTPQLRPIYAFTYAPVEGQNGMSVFLNIVISIKNFYDQHKNKVMDFIPQINRPREIPEERITQVLWNNFDAETIGFGMETKFPTHSTIIFMLYYFKVTRDEKLKEMTSKMLDVMRLKGLADHLQGGFFRYTVDAQWRIPHFEKMLYDQALLLWEYSLAYSVLGKKQYETTARKIIRCLEETFENEGVYYSGHDADIDHVEGATYLWAYEDLNQILTPEELERFKQVYDISEQGNFEGKNHLIKKEDAALDEIENKLLSVRMGRKQPFVDRKIITMWNCLAGISFIQAYKYLQDKELLRRAQIIYENLTQLNCRDGKIFHSSIDGKIQNGEFLQDYAAMLLLLTYLNKETGKYQDEINKLYDAVKKYKEDDIWVESSNEDFLKVTADDSDNPTPSSISLAEMAVLKTDMLNNRPYLPAALRLPLLNDFFNISALIRNGVIAVEQL